MGNLKLALLGTGKVAHHLAMGFKKARIEISLIFGRDLNKAQQLASSVDASETSDTQDLSQCDANIFIVCVADDAIESLADELILPEEAVIAHTSGSISIKSLNKHKKHGVFYPLQSFTENRRINLQEVPLCLEASNPESLAILESLGRSISERIYYINSEQRKALHLAAVFGSNFVNHLLFLSKKITEENNLGWEMLEPLIKETIEKAFAIGPNKAQTGPAWREDKKVIESHLKKLEKDQLLHDLYKIISESIMKSKKE